MSADKFRAPHAIVFIPYAGGSACSLPAVRLAVQESRPFVGVQYPGRHAACATQAPRSVGEMADHAVACIRAARLTDVTLFGYSLGALVAHEVALRMQDEAACPVRHVVVAACRPPHLFRGSGMSACQGDEAFLTEVARLGGVPRALLRDARRASHFLPVLRADFGVCDRFTYVERGALTLPLTVLGGTRDQLAPLADVTHWRQHTTNAYRERILPGDHFFINQHASAAAALLTLDYVPCCASMEPVP
ncbi:thioesterase II family protein [Paraburkholderia lacunae]|uniref:Thioesterase domain-containing protein n=1 Tax=Paraburkholderia lacunae TaxID=2211104 RepID=A0A370NAW0_9BURK|nr:thioesterase domain-containing protein [Paraburkholderia lacunae]RDK02747.1 hypothetical protein DLM46_10875 [Paraburkholderia lacunae]